jgi:hypothetical protein
MSTEEDLGKEDSTSSDRRAYMRSIWYNQKTTPCIKWREKLRETQLSVVELRLPAGRAPRASSVKKKNLEYTLSSVYVLFS